MIRKVMCLVAMVGAIFVFEGLNCLEDDSAGSVPLAPERKTLTIRLVNAHDLATHLFLNSETFPCCRVDPDGVRVVTGSGVTDEDFIFRAGRNGEILATVRCDPTGTTNGATVRVLYSGQNLGCQGW